MRKPTILVATATFGSIVGAFIRMTFSTSRALFAIPHQSKCSTGRCGRVDVDVGIWAFGLRAIATKEMEASGNTVRGENMRKVAVFLTDYTRASV